MGYIGNRPTAVPLTSADFVDDSVTLAKMAGLARGKLIYGDTSGDPAALAVGSANEVLTHDGTDFDWAAGGLTGVTTGSGNVTITNGDLILGTSGKGIDFSATAGAGTSELFDDYEEGTWTPAFRNYSGTESVTAARYTKIGRMVYASVRMARTDATSDGSACEIGGLPFTSVNSTNGMGGGLINYTDSSTGMRFQVLSNADYVQANSTSGTNVNYNDFGANKEIRMIIIYEAA